MTQEEKQLLLKDLCGRLIYELKGLHRGEVQRLLIMDSFGSYQVNGYNAWFNLNSVEFKPYLRPMSSMTAEEEDELYTVMDWYGEIDKYGNVYTKGQEKVYRETFYEYTDWFNEHHFDYRGLIEKGLALEAPEGMYD